MLKRASDSEEDSQSRVQEVLELPWRKIDEVCRHEWPWNQFRNEAHLAGVLIDTPQAVTREDVALRSACHVR